MPSADRAAALLLLASEAWVGVSSRLRTPPSTVVAGSLRATWPQKNSPEYKRKTQRRRRKEWMRIRMEAKQRRVGVWG